MILFLDFDGVLHPDSAYWHPGYGIVFNATELPDEYKYANLFCYADSLAAALEGFPQVQIILSTSWVPTIGYSRSRARLPDSLRRRVIGATYHSVHTPKWNYQSRFQQIVACVGYLGLGSHWFAVDNDDTDWPDDQRDRLVHTNDNRGIADPAALEKLREILSA